MRGGGAMSEEVMGGDGRREVIVRGVGNRLGKGRGRGSYNYSYYISKRGVKVILSYSIFNQSKYNK